MQEFWSMIPDLKGKQDSENPLDKLAWGWNQGHRGWYLAALLWGPLMDQLSGEGLMYLKMALMESQEEILGSFVSTLLDVAPESDDSNQYYFQVTERLVIMAPLVVFIWDVPEEYTIGESSTKHCTTTEKLMRIVHPECQDAVRDILNNARKFEWKTFDTYLSNAS